MMLHTSNEPIVKPLLHFPFGAALLEKKLEKMAAEGYELVDCSGIMNLYTLTYRKGEPKEQRYLVMIWRIDIGRIRGIQPHAIWQKMR